jgi:lipopolysaccharide biosynthesis regulator YciM
MRGTGSGLALGVLAAALCLAPAQAARKPDPNKLPSIHVQDLHYGEVLFQYYCGQELEALTELEAFSQWQRMPHHEHDADLLAGGLYLELGIHNEAGARFERLLTPDVPAGVRNRAWFYLAKIWYERGYYDRAEQAIGRIQGDLGPELEAERVHLLVNALMREQRYDDAIALLKGWHGPADWMAYAGFNLGVALVRAGRLAEADPILTQVGTLDVRREELLNLRDKANLALGFAYLQANQSDKARVPLERVRLNGPYSSRALLGDGWARAALGDYRGALTPWLELRKRNLLDAAVQESYLAVPYAYSKLNAGAQSADYYETALQSFADESGNLDRAIDQIHEGHMLDELLGEDKDARYGWFWQLKALPDSPQSRYLYTVLADNDFQAGLKNYRDMAYLSRTLRHWDESMDAFGAMIDTRRRAYAERLPRADALLASDRLSQLNGNRTAVGSQLDAAETGDEVASLGNPTERAQWASVARLEEQLASLPPGPERDETRDKLHLIKGVLYWRLDASFKARAYQEQRVLREIDTALEELQNRWVRVQQARTTVPSDTDEFAGRIAALAARVQAMRELLAQTSQQQSHYLDDVAESELRAQKERLDAYAVQARFALADIYDRADKGGADAEPAAGPPPAPAPAPAPAPEAK